MGEPRMLYDLQFGQPMALLIFDNPEAADTRTAVATLGGDDPDWAQITRVALVRGTPRECSRLVNGESVGLTILADDGVIAAHLLGPALAGQRLITAFVTDSNLRVIERIEYVTGGSVADFLQQVTAVYQREAPRTPQVFRQQAPVLFIPRVLDAGFCDELIALFEKDGGQPSGVAHIEGDKALRLRIPLVKIRRDVYIKEGEWLQPHQGRADQTCITGDQALLQLPSHAARGVQTGLLRCQDC